MVKKIIAGMLALILLASAAGCAGEPASQSTSATTRKPAASATRLAGKVVIDGSGTVYPLMARIAEEYMTKEQPDVSVQVGRVGSSAGFKKFIPGEIDLADSSRKIKEEEITQLEAKGLQYAADVLEIKLALDGLTFVINKNNTWATAMTRDELVGMFRSGHFKADDKVLWSDIRPAWPGAEVKFYGPNENHGTYEFFYETIMKKQDLVKTVNLQQEYSTLVDLVSKDVNAIAFFGFGYYVNNKSKIAAVQVDFGSGPVEPAIATIGETLPYAGFTRPVFTYLNLKYARGKPQVLDFAKYIVSPQGARKLAGETGFAPLPDAEYDAYLARLKAIG